MENDTTIRDMKERICNLEQVVKMAARLVRQYEEILGKLSGSEWCVIREQILNESSKL